MVPVKLLGSRTNLPGSSHNVFVRRQLFCPHGSARMDATRGDTNLGAHAELAAIRKLGRGIVQQNRAVDRRKEAVCCIRVFSDDTFCVSG